MDTGTLVERVNSAAKDAGDINQPGVRAIVERLRARGETLSPKELVEGCLELAGGIKLSSATFDRLESYVSDQGDLRFAQQDISDCSEQRVADLLQLIVATREYQLA